jgi:phosphoribosyl 1,2-cyclic phosphodiesterase
VAKVELGMAHDPVFRVTYWGATGTLAAPLRPAEVADKLVRAIAHLVEQDRLVHLRPGPGLTDTIRRLAEEALPFHLRSCYGGNTTCLEVQTPDALLILDCGTGCRELGVALEHRWNAPDYSGSRSAHVLISHPHMDHTLAIPFFGPFYDPRNHFTLWGSRSVLHSMEAVLDPVSPLSRLYFPPSMDLMKAIRDFRPLEAGTSFSIGSTQVRTLALRHPGGCLAYRLENAGRAFVFATDHEHTAVPDPVLAEFARGADLLYTEGQYLQIEYEGRQALPGEAAPLRRHGWGHSPAEACVTTAVAAGVKALHVGHRDPQRRDDQLSQLQESLRLWLAEELSHQEREIGSCQVLIPFEGLSVDL